MEVLQVTYPPELIRRSKRRADVHVLPVAVAVGSLILFVWPVVMIVIGAFRTAPQGANASWTLDGVRDVFLSPDTYAVAGTTLAVAIPSSIIAIVFASALAFVATRTDFGGRRLITPAMLALLAFPQIFYAISWVQFADGGIGVVNTFARSAWGFDPGVNVTSFVGVVIVSGLKLSAICYFLLYGPISMMDSSQEEAAFVSGVGRIPTLFRVTLRALRPAVISTFVLCLVVAVEYLEIPLLLGTQAGVRVYANDIYFKLQNDVPPNFTEASALSILLILNVGILLAIQFRVLRNRSYTTLSGRGLRDNGWRLGAWTALISPLVYLYLLVAVGIPVLMLIWQSTQPYAGAITAPTIRNFQLLLSNPEIRSALLNTVVLAVLAGVLSMVVCLIITFVVRTYPSPASRVASAATWFPWAAPGIVMALGLLWAYLAVPGFRELYGTPALLVIGLAIITVPVVMRSLESSVGQVGRELEESAWVSGVSKPRAFVVIVCRSVRPSIISGAILAAVIISGNFSMPILLASIRFPTLPVKAFDLYRAGAGTQSAALFCVMLVIIVGCYLVIALITAAAKAMRTHAVPTMPATSTNRAAEPQDAKHRLIETTPISNERERG